MCSVYCFPTRRSSDLRGGIFPGLVRSFLCSFLRCFTVFSPAAAGCSCFLVEKQLVVQSSGGLNFPVPSSKFRADRKSTRLNSSHVSISYAVFRSKKNN